MQETLAEVLKAGEVCDRNLASRATSLRECRASLVDASPKPWQEPTVIVSGYVVSFGLGALFMATHCFGACK